MRQLFMVLATFSQIAHGGASMAIIAIMNIDQKRDQANKPHDEMGSTSDAGLCSLDKEASMDWLKDHWRKLAGIAIATAGYFYPPLIPLTTIGGIILGSDFQVGSKMGTPLGPAAKQLVDQLGKRPPPLPPPPSSTR